MGFCMYKILYSNDIRSGQILSKFKIAAPHQKAEVFFLHSQTKTNMEPKHLGLEEYFPFQRGYF